MNRDDCVELGYISKAHGIRGEVKAVFDVQDINAYRKVKQLFLAKKGAPLAAWEVSGISFREDNLAIIRFKASSDRNEAEALKGHTIFFPISLLPQLEEGQFYFFELPGFMVVDQEAGEVGTITSILDQPGNTLLVVDAKGTEVLVPTHEDVLLEVNKAEEKVYVNLPEGLLELYLNPGKDQS